MTEQPPQELPPLPSPVITPNPTEAQINTIRHPLQQFNAPNWDTKKKDSYLITLTLEQSGLIGGAVYTILGLWLEIDYLWVHSDQRGKKIGTHLLHHIENHAKSLGCTKSFLNTYKFQAQPFYEKHGYSVVYTQPNQPISNTRLFMEKNLQDD